MRKAQKKQAEDFVALLGQSHDEIKRAVDRKNIPAALGLLADCQEGAIALGNLIEKTEGEGNLVIPLLEEYCELVYQLHEGLAGENQGSGVMKQLRQQLFRIKNGVRGIKARTEAVFLPYKVSMWDSLESVWKAAEEDENCDVYVIPIPYYDKNPDGSFREMHYEGTQYPEYVPVTWYEDFDFEVHQPDMIFIHNAYDDANFVTSVHPFFYSSNLKKYTEKLIYIPYFVLDEIRPEEDEKITYMRHFCTSPGVFYADRVIVQSEDMRQVYIKVLMEETGDDSREARKYWSDKILGLGSPKFDKVADIEEEEADIPEEWRKLIRKMDGSRKKVILYNTGIAGLLTYNEKMLAKIRDVFDIFRENQEEITLLWRPHPLIESTLTSMRPHLRQEYQAIRDRYQAEGWGIYDDTADLNRAIAVSDAYYGDESSVVQLYKRTGKPVMLQDTHILCGGDVNCEGKERN